MPSCGYIIATGVPRGTSPDRASARRRLRVLQHTPQKLQSVIFVRLAAGRGREDSRAGERQVGTGGGSIAGVIDCFSTVLFAVPTVTVTRSWNVLLCAL